MLQFTHSGTIGDILYSIFYCRQLSKKYGFKKFNLHIQTSIFLTKKEAQSLKTLLDTQTYIKQVTIGDYKPKDSIDLSKFRNGLINCNSGDVREYYYAFNSNSLPRHFWIKTIRVKWPVDTKYQGKILFNLSESNININLNYKLLETFKDKLVFVGTLKEYNTFITKYFKIDEFVDINESLLTVAKYISGAKGVVSNQSDLFALAELMKVPRILLAPDFVNDSTGKVILGSKNVIPLGKWNVSVSLTEKMLVSVGELINLNYIEQKDEKEEE